MLKCFDLQILRLKPIGLSLQKHLRLHLLRHFGSRLLSLMLIGLHLLKLKLIGLSLQMLKRFGLH